jgi:glycosyltransferase involved in cell wall biosynthesis
MQKPVHIVTRLHGIGGAETHSFDLTNALNRHGIPARLWSDTASEFVSHFNGTAISPYNGVFPMGGTLIIVGTYFGVDPWIDHVRPERLIVICVNSDPRQLYAMLATLDRPTLPPVEMAFVSTRLRDTMGVTGYICPEIVDLDRFQARKTRGDQPFTIGRLSRDIPEKHHPQDPSLYRILGWRGIRTRIMGGVCLRPELNEESSVDLLAINREKPENFLLTLDVFYYRTHPSLHESSGRVIVEAMACGLPIVAHKSGGYTDWVTPGENGYIFSTQEEAFQTLNILRNDADLLQRLSSGARESAERIAGHEACRAYFSWLTGIST